MRKLTEKSIRKFIDYLEYEERSPSTLERYTRDILRFSEWLGEGNADGKNQITKATVLNYKAFLLKKYAPTSVNSILSSLNSCFAALGWDELRVKTVRIQRQIFVSGERELTKREYTRLLNAASEKGKRRLFLLLQTICATGIRVSELSYVTVEALRCGRAEISCKGKIRFAFIPPDLCEMLRLFCRECGVERGPVFVSRGGKPLDRSNIWSEMKRLCRAAGVRAEKVYPHNLRHLFARTYYTLEKDIVRLADLLGHSSVNTTRIYTMESADSCRKHLQGLGLTVSQ